MKEADAQIFIEAMVNCPYCNYYQNVFSGVQEGLGFELSAKDIDEEVLCAQCDSYFLVKDVNY